jgi:signal transduction histidine kinase
MASTPQLKTQNLYNVYIPADLHPEAHKALAALPCNVMGDTEDLDHYTFAVFSPNAPSHPHVKKLAQLRRENPALPILLLIPAQDMALKQLTTLLRKASASDFAMLPVHPLELELRIQSLLIERQANQDKEEARKRAAADRQAISSERQELDVLKDSLISAISHEFRTPILQMKSAVKLLQDQVQENPTFSSLHDHISFAQQAASRLEDAVINVGQLASTTNIRIEPFRPVDAATLAERRLQKAASTHQRANRVKINVLSSLPLALGDKNAIAIVLHQLIDNGLKFSQDDQEVHVGAEVITSAVSFWVRDYGIGIQTDKLGLIFEEFYQADSRDNKRFYGLGIGLSIVKLLLERMDITITVESQPGQGSLFRFAVPFYQ